MIAEFEATARTKKLQWALIPRIKNGRGEKMAKNPLRKSTELIKNGATRFQTKSIFPTPPGRVRGPLLRVSEKPVPAEPLDSFECGSPELG